MVKAELPNSISRCVKERASFIRFLEGHLAYIYLLVTFILTLGGCTSLHLLYSGSTASKTRFRHSALRNLMWCT